MAPKVLSEVLISDLLFEAEGAELDFKRDQYPFEKADDRAKSELLKDILAFANAWRRSDAYILIGVQEVKEGASIVVGLTEHIDDAKLQQFINTKTNRPVDFSYTPTLFQGKQVGVIHIPLQMRPIYLKKDFGPMRCNTVYLRRGSSTAVASPDEIARMGQDHGERLKPRPILAPQLVTGSDWSQFNKTASFATARPIFPEIQRIPDYIPKEEAGLFRIQPFSERSNPDYYRELAKHLRFLAQLRPIRMAVRNDGTALATGVKLVFEIADPQHKIELVGGWQRPEKPSPVWSPFPRQMQSVMRHLSPDIEVDKTSAGWKVVSRLDKIQAKDTAVTKEQLFVGVSQSSRFEIAVQVFADELPNPVCSVFTLDFEVTDVEVPIDKLIG